VSAPAAWFAGPGGEPDRVLLALMGLSALAAVPLADLSGRLDAVRRERVAVGVIAVTTLLVIAAAARSTVAGTAWVAAFAAVGVGMTTIRDGRTRSVAQTVAVVALAALLAGDHPAPTSVEGLTEVVGPLVLLIVVAGLSSALADDLGLARRRELATRRAAERRAELLEAVRDLGRAGPGQAIDVTVDALLDLGFPVAAVLLVDGDRLRPVRVEGMASRGDFDAGVSGHALVTGRTVVTGNYQADALRLPGVELGAAVATPIQADGRTLGVMAVGLAEAGTPPLGDVEVVEVLAAHLGGALATERVVENQRDLLRRLRALDALRAGFVDRVSEDLRDPLTVVRGVAQTLAAFEARLPEEQRRVLLERLTAQATDLGGTLEALLDFSRINVGRAEPEPEPCDAVELLAPALTGTGVTLDVAGRPVVVVDRELVRRAVELLRRATIDVDRGLTLRPVGDDLALDVHLQVTDGLQGGFALALAAQLLVAAGARSQALPDGLRVLLPLARPEDLA
jgi:K+-sensing histidine kinase KdpD